jgi:hypothetical protein
MRILFHVGVGNTDRPHRWSFVNGLFSGLARSFESLGHECLVWYHPAAKHPKMHSRNLCSDKVNHIGFNPDWVFTWNGVSPGDQQIIKTFGHEKMIYGELGFFDHYNTLYFDFSGVNGKSENLIESLPQYDESIYQMLLKKYHKLRKFNDPFVFVPLQDETDTQITKYSPFKKMQELLDYVYTLYGNTNLKILYKKHPKYNCHIINDGRFIEVTDDIHHYLPYADMVIGINSTALLEALVYHNRVMTLGIGISSRTLCNEDHKKYVTYLYQKQFNWNDMENLSKVKNSYFYKRMLCKN